MNEKSPKQIYSSEVLEAHKNGDIYIHKLDEIGKGYSSGWSVNKIEEKYNPRNLDEFLRSVLEHLRILKHEWIGPQSFNNIDLYTQKYTGHKSELYYSFLRSLPTRTAFSINPQDIRSEIFHRYFLESLENLLLKGVFHAIPIINIKDEIAWNSPMLNQYIAYCFKYGNAHFQNFLTGTITFDQLTEKPRTRDLSNVYLRQGSIVGNSDDRGILSISTINLPRLGYSSKSEDDFFSNLEKVLDVVIKASDQKRIYLEKRLKNGDLPVTEDYLDSFDWHYSVINLSGMNEALLRSIDAGTAHVAGKAVSYKLLEKILWTLEDHQEESGNMFSLESLPSEEVGSILAEKDSLKFPDMFDVEPVYYTGSTNLPIDHGSDLWDWLEHQKKFHSIYTGGSIFQVILSEMISFRTECVLLIRKILEEFGYNYLKISPTFSLCEEHGYLKGHKEICNVCGKSTTIYTWIDGYLRSLSSLNQLLKEAYKKRVHHHIKSN
jgi:ribonucleoside-triphosphate reductase